MNKKKSKLGRSLIKDRFHSGSGKKFVADNSMLHTTEIKDGYDWGRLNLQSVTEQSSFQEFLSTAELVETEYQAEKLNIKFVNPLSKVGQLSKEESEKIKQDHEKYKEHLRIPRRPHWTDKTTPSELDQNEKEHFLNWRRDLAKLQQEFGCVLTPYEKNLEFWRQLWRVVERSDVIVQIVDARNPLLFRCEDLEKYVVEVSENKMNMILLNKADLLTEQQRQIWADYFTSKKMRAFFFSATLLDETEKCEKIPEEQENADLLEENDGLEIIKEKLRDLEIKVENTAKKLVELLSNIDGNNTDIKNSSDLLTREQLIEILRIIHKGPKVTQGLTTIGLVGYPNVGKSSTINALMTEKKVSVSATPGKTKHFQTLYLDEDILLCDCPGLVMPSFVISKADMILNGILPIDHMRDHVPPVNLVASLIPRRVLEDMYGIMLPKPTEGEDPNRCPTSEELLNAYGYNRGFMTSNGQPDNPRSSRYILKDFMNGKLLYCHAPPTVLQEEYHIWPETRKPERNMTPREVRAIRGNKISGADIDKVFFQNKNNGVYAKGVIGKSAGIPENLQNAAAAGGKPWKKINKHANKNKKEKLRRVYSHLDIH